MSSKHVEVLERLRGVLEHGKMGDKCLIAPDLVTAALAALSAPQPPAEAQGGEWINRKPSRPGVYGVRGFNLGAAPEDQFEAIVSVRLYRGELVCNLHESTSEESLDRWAPVEYFSNRFEWCEFLPAATPSAPVGVEGDWRAEYDQFAAIVNALHGAGESMERAVVLARGVTEALAQQPAAVDGVKCPWDGGSPCVEPRPIGMVYPMKPAPRASGYLDGSGVEWNAWDAEQMEAYARAAYSDGWEAGYRAALRDHDQEVEGG